MTLKFWRFLVISLSLIIRVIVLVWKLLNYDVSLSWSVKGVLNHGEIIDISISVSISGITIMFVLKIIKLSNALTMILNIIYTL